MYLFRGPPISTNSADAGFSILAATVNFAFSKTGSGGSGGLLILKFLFSYRCGRCLIQHRSGVGEGCADGGTSGSMIPDFAFSSTGPPSFRGLAAVGFADVAIFLYFAALFLDFAAVFVGSGLNAVRFDLVGLVAAVLTKQPCEVHRSTIRRGGELQPIKVAHRAQMRSVLINSFSQAISPVCGY